MTFRKHLISVYLKTILHNYKHFMFFRKQQLFYDHKDIVITRAYQIRVADITYKGARSIRCSIAADTWAPSRHSCRYDLCTFKIFLLNSNKLSFLLIIEHHLELLIKTTIFRSLAGRIKQYYKLTRK